MTLMAFSLATMLAAGGTVAPGSETNSPLAERLALYSEKLPRCLSRFLDYPPGRGKLGFPRCLFENPFPANPDFWLKDIDFTCVSPWNDSYGRHRAGTAISKRHIIFANHFPLAVGTRMAFVGENGDTSHYSVKATKALPSSDIMIGLLDYELTPDVRPAKILPAGFDRTITLGSKWPIVTFNQNEQVYLSEATCRTYSHIKGITFGNGKCTRESEQKFGGEIISGDSGNPAFMLYRGTPVLLYCLGSGGVGHGPLIHLYRDEVQKAMDELCPGYSLESVDLESSVPSPGTHH